MNCQGCDKNIDRLQATFFPEYPENPLCYDCTRAKVGGGKSLDVAIAEIEKAQAVTKSESPAVPEPDAEAT